jgi:glucose-1-phosphate thymidylyltransferase
VSGPFELGIVVKTSTVVAVIKRTFRAGRADGPRALTPVYTGTTVTIVHPYLVVVQAVVPAAGEGSRLRPLTADTPKPLVEVAGKPLLEHCLERLCAVDVSEIVVVVGYRGDQIRARYGDSFDGVPLRYARQSSPEGMADALLAARRYVDQPFVVMDGDSVVEADLSRCLARQRDGDVDATTLVEAVPPARAREKAVCRLSEGRVAAIENKPDDPPDPSFVASAVHTFTPEVFDVCELLRRSPRGEYELADALGVLVRARHRVAAVECEGWVGNVNTPEERDAVERRLLDESRGGHGARGGREP